MQTLNFSELTHQEKLDIVNSLGLYDEMSLFAEYDIGGIKFNITDSATAYDMLIEFEHNVYDESREYFNINRAIVDEHGGMIEFYTRWGVCGTWYDVYVSVEIGKYEDIRIIVYIDDNKTGKQILKPTKEYAYSDVYDMLCDVKSAMYYIHDCALCIMEVQGLCDILSELLDNISDLTTTYERDLRNNMETVVMEFLEGHKIKVDDNYNIIEVA